VDPKRAVLDGFLDTPVAPWPVDRIREISPLRQTFGWLHISC